MGNFVNKWKEVGTLVEDGGISVQQVNPKHILIQGEDRGIVGGDSWVSAALVATASLYLV